MQHLLKVGVLVVALGAAGALAACGGDEGSGGSTEPAPAESTSLEPTPAPSEPAPTEPSQTESAAAPTPTPGESATAPSGTESGQTATGTAAPTGQGPATAAGAKPGGTYRIGIESSFNFTGGFDPTGEYLAEAVGLMTNTLVRTLLSYRHAPGEPGNELVPDLAKDLPEVSEDGLTWTFQLKDGIKFGPPLSREITSKDFLTAFKRIGTKALVAQYDFYYVPVIEGMADFKAGKATEISGIQTPDDKTIVFKLTQPTGDFGYRLSMPAAGPMPAEVTDCFTKAQQYGRDLVSSGPYMIAGSDKLDASSCAALKPLSGYEPNRRLTLVRNPDYDPATDSPEYRENLPDSFDLIVNSNNQDIFDQIDAGSLEGEWASVPPKSIRQLESEKRLKLNPGDRTWYITMNLTLPPFDDVHVRKAMNLVMDKTGLVKSWGGPAAGSVAGHIIPDNLLSDTLKGYDPYGSDGQTGDVDAAKEEMKQSKYDTDQDGECDAPACKNILLVSTNIERFRGMEPVISQSAGQIGLTFNIRELEDAYTPIQTTANNIPISNRPGWGKDYPDASTFAVLFDGRNIIPQGNTNYSLIGVTQAMAADLGLTGNLDGVPNVDADIDTCRATPTGDERIQCWADLDKKLMEEVVPWVPYLSALNQDVIGPAVTFYQYDQSNATMAYSHLAVDPGKQQ